MGDPSVGAKAVPGGGVQHVAHGGAVDQMHPGRGGRLGQTEDQIGQRHGGSERFVPPSQATHDLVAVEDLAPLARAHLATRCKLRGRRPQPRAGLHGGGQHQVAAIDPRRLEPQFLRPGTVTLSGAGQQGAHPRIGTQGVQTSHTGWVPVLAHQGRGQHRHSTLGLTAGKRPGHRGGQGAVSDDDHVVARRKGT